MPATPRESWPHQKQLPIQQRLGEIASAPGYLPLAEQPRPLAKSYTTSYGCGVVYDFVWMEWSM